MRGRARPSTVCLSPGSEGNPSQQLDTFRPRTGPPRLFPFWGHSGESSKSHPISVMLQLVGAAAIQLMRAGTTRDRTGVPDPLKCPQAPASFRRPCPPHPQRIQAWEDAPPDSAPPTTAWPSPSQSRLPSGSGCSWAGTPGSTSGALGPAPQLYGQMNHESPPLQAVPCAASGVASRPPAQPARANCQGKPLTRLQLGHGQRSGSLAGKRPVTRPGQSLRQSLQGGRAGAAEGTWGASQHSGAPHTPTPPTRTPELTPAAGQGKDGPR